MSEPVRSIRKAYHQELVILAVEDHAIFSKDIKHALPQHRVIFARTLEEAKRHYDECLPDVTLIDIDLPDGNGFELLDYIRAREAEAYAIILTGSKLPEDLATAREKSAQDYIIKPCTRSKIEQAIEKYLSIRERTIESLLIETQQHRHEAVKDKE